MNSATAIQTYTGIFFDPFNPHPEAIRIEDIAHALTMLCRFNGHVRKRWSVAQHSLLVSDLCPRDLKLAGLLHDASEAYLCDLPRPIKHHGSMGFYRATESGLDRVIAGRFGLPWRIAADVKAADNMALIAEACALKHGLDGWIRHMEDWGFREVATPDPQLVAAISSATRPSDEYIRDEFLRTFRELGGQ